MRIAYFTFNWPRTIQSGVGRKMLTQMACWRETGHVVAYFMHAHGGTPAGDLIPGAHVFYRDAPGLGGKLRREFSRAAAMQRVIEAVAAFRPDGIYLRSGRYVFPIQRLFRIAPVIIEINGNESAQERMYGWHTHLLHRLGSPLMYRRASGFVTISRQLAEQPALSRYRKPTLVMGNSFDVAAAQPFPAPANSVPRIVFIGSPGNPWHGVDKLARLARIAPDLAIDVVGYDQLEESAAASPNLALHGYLPRAQYLQVLAQADLAISSVGLHRADLWENSLLKTRECLAYGLPMVLAYRDTDLEGLDVDWLLSIPNREDNLETSAQAIRDFAYRMRGRRADHAVVLERLDAAKKEAQRVEFLQAICGVQA